MNNVNDIGSLRHWLNSMLHSDWLGTVLLAVAICLATALAAHLTTIFLKRFLQSKKGPLPAASIFINIGRITVWVLGLSIMLSACFDINVGAAVTALGIGGIAISLGFQDTLSNLIGGLQIIMTGLVEPGERIKVSNYTGTVRDVTWRHTTIVDVEGQSIVIPNSVINTQALIKLPPETDVRVNIVITDTGDDLDELVKDMEQRIDEAVEKIAVIKNKTDITVNGKTERGYNALVSLTVGEGVKRGTVIDTVMRAISKCAHKSKSSHAHGHRKALLAGESDFNDPKPSENSPLEALKSKLEDVGDLFAGKKAASETPDDTSGTKPKKDDAGEQPSAK